MNDDVHYHSQLELAGLNEVWCVRSKWRPRAWNPNPQNASGAFIDLKRLIATNARHLNFLSDHHNTAAARYGQTTERYLGSRQNLKKAVNDRLGLDQ